MTNSIYCLRHRANINTFLTKSKTVVVYEDHRYILNILRYAFENKILEKPINVISFDYHSDSYDNPSLLTLENINKVKSLGLKEFWNFIEFEHSIQDDDWLVSGMEYGLINDVALMFVKEIFSGIDFNKPYFDTEQNVHNPILIDTKSNSMEINTFKKIMENKFILDIDLDFASKVIEDKIYPYSNDELDVFFNQELMFSTNETLTVSELFKELIKKSSFITICKESEFCGGYSASNKVLEYLDEKYFDNELMK